MQIIDISGPIYTGMWQYCPQYPGARITECGLPEFAEPNAELYCQKFEIGGQTGTYVETAAHLDSAATPVADLPLDRFVLDCVIVRLADKAPGQRIGRDEIRAAAPEILPGEAILLRTGWDRQWREPDFVDGSPYLSREAAEWLMERQPALLGADLSRFDCVAAPEFPWRRFFARVELLLAPVVNLDAVPVDRAKLIALPLRIERAVSTPCRAAILCSGGVRARSSDVRSVRSVGSVGLD